MKTKDKPKYGIVQNVSWMVRLAWKVRRRVLLICLLTAFLEVAYNLTLLYIAPEILVLVEQHAPLGRLFATIFLFTATLFCTLGAKQYLTDYATYPRVDVRSAIIGMIAAKCNTTSFPNTLKPDYIKMRDKSHTATEGNDQATEYIWQVLTDLLKDIGGFVVYLTILSHLNMTLMLVIIITCLAGFLISKKANNWIYQHRDYTSIYYVKKAYIRRKAESAVFAKDIRIFSLQSWLNELLDNVHDAYLCFRLKVEKRLVIANITEAVLTMARNGIAYVYLVNMALNDGLSVSEFILYFRSVYKELHADHETGTADNK